ISRRRQAVSRSASRCANVGTRNAGARNPNLHRGPPELRTRAGPAMTDTKPTPEEGLPERDADAHVEMVAFYLAAGDGNDLNGRGWNSIFKSARERYRHKARALIAA